MTKEELINSIIEDWATDFLIELKKEAARINRSSGEGADSFDVDFMRMSSAGVAQIMVDFRDYLRLRDMRRTSRENHLGKDALARLKKWIEREGVQNFLSGYKYPTKVRKKGGRLADVSTTRIINNIAWGISVKKSKIKPVRWYNRKKGHEIYRLYGSLVNAIADQSMKEMKAAALNPG